MTIDDIIKTLPPARRAKVRQRALALIMEETQRMADNRDEAADEVERLTRFLINALDALEAVDSEIALTGHIKELVDCALALRDKKDTANGR